MPKNPSLKIYFITFFLIIYSASSFSQSRPMQVDDLFLLEEFAEIEIDPSGRYVAYVIKRSKQPHEYYQRYFINDNGRADIWLYDLKEGETWNLTKGSDKAEGYWNPVWSPNGNYLAMLSTIGNDNVRALVWNKDTNKITIISEVGINTSTRTYGKQHFITRTDPIHWINNNELVLPILGKGQVSHIFELQSRTQAKVLQEWPKALHGYQSTPSIIESGITNGKEIFEKGRILKANISTSRTDTIAKGYFYHLFMSNNKEKFLGLNRAYQDIPRMKIPLTFAVWDHLVLGIGDFKNEKFDWLDIEDVMSSSDYKWSPDDTYLAIKNKNKKQEISYTIYNTKNKNSLKLDTNNIYWTSNNIILEENSAGNKITLRNPDTGKEIKKISANNFRNIYPMRDKSSLLFFDNGIYKLDPKNNKTVELTSKSLKIEKIIQANDKGILLVEATENDDKKYYRLKVNAKDIDIIKLNRPDNNIKIEAYNLENDIGVFKQKTNEGTFLWYSKKGQFSKIKSINSFVSNITEGKNEILEYFSEDGKPLKAIIHYPSNYDSNKKYPVVVWCYMGSIIRSVNHSYLDIQNPTTLNLNPLSEKGYIILIPSMPVSYSDDVKDDYIDMSKGVFPAVDALIKKGIVNPNQIAIGGHSYGGYSVYSLITQTNRFCTAFAMAGFSDLLSEYGKIDIRFRYSDLPYEYTPMPRILETGQSGMSGTPWTNTLKYIKNSPYYYSDRIETPLLIIQGDMDFVSINQGESMFTSLYRQGKRAKFVRYWGEGHVFESPANIKDMWKNIFTWLEQSMKY